MIYTCNVIEVDGDMCLEFTDELMEALNLKVGDNIEWNITEEGEVSFRKIDGNNDTK
jgi:uncharacterized membrane protein (UPF0127 family)